MSVIQKQSPRSRNKRSRGSIKTLGLVVAIAGLAWWLWAYTFTQGGIDLKSPIYNVLRTRRAREATELGRKIRSGEARLSDSQARVYATRDEARYEGGAKYDYYWGLAFLNLGIVVYFVEKRRLARKP